MRILILDGDSSAGCAILQSLGAAGYECWLAACGTDHAAFTSRYVARAAVYPNPLSDKSAFQRWALDFHQQHRFALIIPPTEATLIPLHEARDEPGFADVLALPPPRAVELGFDKEQVRALAASLGIATPPNLLIHNASELKSPAIEEWLKDTAVVIKPIRSKIWSGRGASEPRVQIATSQKELHEFVEPIVLLTPVQLQPWVPGKGNSIELLVNRDEVSMSFAHERIHELPLTGGGSSYRKAIAPPPALLEGSAKLMRALEWHGVAMVEYRCDDASDRHWLMEINGRFWGSLHLPLFAGVDFPNGLVDLLVHHRVPLPQKTPVRNGVYARNVSRDLDWIKAILKSRYSDRFLLRRPLPESLLEWARVLSGKETWDGARLCDPKPILYELKTRLQHEVKNVGRIARRFGLLHRERLRSRSQRRWIAGKRRVLVLCYGNICRSPYAEVTTASRSKLADIELRSSGFFPVPGRKTPEIFQGLARQRGIDLSAHRSRLIDKKDLLWADVIVLMDQKNFEALREFDRKSLSKVVWLGAFDASGPLEIADPYDQPISVVETILDRMDRCLEVLAQTISS